MNVGGIDGPAVIDGGEHEAFGRRERVQPAAVLPNLDGIRWPALQHAYGRLEMKRRLGRPQFHDIKNIST
jgi:hypothetical protein